MKSITILSLSIIALLTMSFNSIHSKKYLELNKKENFQNSNNFIGFKNSVVIGTSATAFPGNIRMVTVSTNQNLSEKKLNFVLNKYNN
jgi:hypothetical protein